MSCLSSCGHASSVASRLWLAGKARLMLEALLRGEYIAAVSPLPFDSTASSTSSPQPATSSSTTPLYNTSYPKQDAIVRPIHDSHAACIKLRSSHSEGRRTYVDAVRGTVDSRLFTDKQTGSVDMLLQRRACAPRGSPCSCGIGQTGQCSSTGRCLCFSSNPI